MSVTAEMTLSPRMQALINKPEVKKRLKRTLFEILLFVLGRSSRNKISDSNPPTSRDTRPPLVKGFAKWRSPTNKRTRSFSKYKSKKYKDLKSEKGKRNFLHFSGALYDDMIKNAKIRILGGGNVGRITPGNRNKSRNYNFVHHNGNKTTPQRRAYQIDQNDKKFIKVHIKKSLKTIFGGK